MSYAKLISMMAGSASPGGGPSFFDPNDIASVWAWFEADSYAQADESSVTTDWQDQSPNNRDITLSGSGTVLYKAGEVNGQDALDIPGGRYFALPSMVALTSGHYFKVMKNENNAGPGGDHLGTGDNNHYLLSFDSKIYDAFGSTARKDALTNQVTVTNWHCVHGHSAASDWGMYQNASTVHTTSSNNVGFPSNPKLFRNAGGTDWEGMCAAVYFFSSKLTGGDLAGIKSRITDKYGISF